MKSESLGRSTVTLTASKIITLIVSMCATMLLSRFRTVEEYGTYSQLLLVINLASTLIMLGLPSSINYFLSRTETISERQRFLSVYYSLSTVLSLIIGIVLVACVPMIEAYFHNPAIKGFSYFLALYPWASIISSSIENILVVFKKTRFLMSYRIIHSVALLLSVLAVQWLGYGFSTYMVVFVIINCIFSLSVYVIAFSLVGGIRFRADKELIIQIFRFSVPIGLATVVGTLNTEIDKLLIGYLMDTEQLAIYSNAAKELPLTIVASSVTAVLLPQLTRMIKKGKTKEALKLWGNATELSYIVIAFLVSCIFVFAEEALTILYSAKYLPGVGVFRVYTLNLLLRVTYFGIVLNACGKTKKIFWCSIYSLLLNMLLNPLFYYLFGMIGPAIATFLAILLILLLQLRMTSGITGASFSEVFPWKQIGKTTMINIVFAAVFWECKHFLHLEAAVGEIWESVLLGGVWFVVYFLVMRGKLVLKWNLLNAGGETFE